MAKRYWEETDVQGFYVSLENSEVMATLESDGEVNGKAIWRWVERKRAFLTRQAAIKAVERAL